MRIFQDFTFTNPGKVQNQIIPRVSIFALEVKDDG